MTDQFSPAPFVRGDRVRLRADCRKFYPPTHPQMATVLSPNHSAVLIRWDGHKQPSSVNHSILELA